MFYQPGQGAEDSGPNSDSKVVVAFTLVQFAKVEDSSQFPPNYP